MQGIATCLCVSATIVGAFSAQLEINLGQVEVTSSVGDFTLFPLDIRADVLRNLLQHASSDLKQLPDPTESFYQFNESDWAYEISGTGDTRLTNQDLAAITQKALEIAPPSSQSLTQTIVGVVKAAGAPIADVVINPNTPVSMPQNLKIPDFPNATDPTALVSIERITGNGTQIQTEVPQDDPALSGFIDRFEALPSDPTEQGSTLNATGPRRPNIFSPSANVSPLRSRRRRRRSAGEVAAVEDDRINKILGVRRFMKLGNTGFAAKMWIWRDLERSPPVVRVTQVKYAREAIQAAMNTIPLLIEHNKRNKIRPYNEFDAITSEGLDTVEDMDVAFSAWSTESIYETGPPTKLPDMIWQELGKGLLEMLKSLPDDHLTMAMQGVLLNTAAQGEPHAFGNIYLTCLTEHELKGNAQSVLEKPEDEAASA